VQQDRASVGGVIVNGKVDVVKTVKSIKMHAILLDPRRAVQTFSPVWPILTKPQPLPRTPVPQAKHL